MADKPNTDNMSSMRPRQETQVAQAKANPVANLQTDKQNDFELLHEKTNKNELAFKVNGKKATMNEKDVEQLLQPSQAKGVQDNTQQLNKSPKPSPTPTTTGRVSRKDTAQGLIEFLNSPGGKAMQALKRDQAAMLFAMKQQNTADLYHKILLKQLFMANNRLLKIAHKKAEQGKINAENQRLIQKSLAYGRAAAEQSSTASKSPYVMDPDTLKALINRSYQTETRILENDLKESHEEASQLEQELLAHEAYGLALDERHENLDEAVEELHEHSDAMALLDSDEERHDETKAIRKDIKAKIEKLTQKIQKNVAEGNHEKAAKLMNKLDKLNIKALDMKEMMHVYKAHKHFFDEEGNRVKDYTKATYVLDSTQHLHKDGSGKLYLLEKGQHFEEMSTEEKAAAQAKFEQAKPELLVAELKVKHYKNNDRKGFEERSAGLLARCENMQARILDLTNQYNAVKADQASAMAEIDKAQSDVSKIPVPKPMPTSTMSPSMEKIQPAGKPQVVPTESYRHVLELMRLNPTPEAIDRLKNNFVLPNGDPNKEAQDAISKHIKPHTPIMLTTMNSLLANLERFGVSANKPSVTSIPSKHPEKAENKNPEPEQSPRTAPTPFKTTPF